MVMVVDEEKLEEAEGAGNEAARGPEASIAEKERERERERERGGGTREGRVEGQQSRGNLISACGGF